jgi:hypothetical protein
MNEPYHLPMYGIADYYDLNIDQEKEKSNEIIYLCRL